MATATELVVAKELADLQAVAEVAGWTVKPLGPTSFIVAVIAGDRSEFWVVCEAEDYPATPPAWRWCAADGSQRDAASRSPSAGVSAFFHNNGVICAPWNRLAYKQVDPRGPHGDWNIGDWQANSYTGQCKSITGMVMRIEIELQLRFAGRVEQAA